MLPFNLMWAVTDTCVSCVSQNGTRNNTARAEVRVQLYKEYTSCPFLFRSKWDVLHSNLLYRYLSIG
jgi:hypothetical protein